MAELRREATIDRGGGGFAATMPAATMQGSSRDFVTPLALKLQQVWLQTQIRGSGRGGGGGGGRSSSNAELVPALPSPTVAATTSSSSESGDSEADSWGLSGAVESRRTLGKDEDALLEYIDNMLMEDHIDQQACLDLEMGIGAFQAELADLIQTKPSANFEVSAGGNGWMNGLPHASRVNATPFASPSSVGSPQQQQGDPLRKSNSLKRSHPVEGEKNDGLQQLIMKVAFAERESLFGLNWKSNGRNQDSRPRLVFQRNEGYARIWEQLGLDEHTHLLEKLVACAEAVSNGDFATPWGLVEDIREEANPVGNAVQRVVFYFMEALIARMTNTGSKMFTALCKARPSTAETLKAVQMILRTTPFLGLPHLYANKIILEACKGHRKVHIVDFGIMYGLQWPALFQLLAERQEGPPQLRITGIDLPPPGFKPSGRIRETGSRLKRCAQDWGIPFKFRSHSFKWENVEPAELQLKDDEVLIINCMFKQTNLFDESVIAESPKNLWLNRIRSLNPKVFIQCVASSGFSPPIFISRFHAALVHHVVTFAAMDSCISRMIPERRVIEQDKYGREIMNIIACDGFDRVERSETHQQWRARALKAGLEMIPLNQSLIEESKVFAKAYHKDLTVDRDGDWMWLGWKNQIIHAYSAWRPASEQALAP